MKPWELIAVSALYLSVAWRYNFHGNAGMAFAFVCYALANFGFMWAAK